MHIFVINLEKDSARRESITSQLQNLKLNFELVSGVYGANLSLEEKERDYDDCKAKWHCCRSLTPSEIGCALSHMKIYKMMVERHIESALILEDDVMLPENLNIFIGACKAKLEASKPLVWLLSPAQGELNLKKGEYIDETHQLLSYKSGYFASSYILTLPAAKSLIAELYPINDVADCWPRISRYRVVDIYAIAPALIGQDQNQFGSSTTSDIQKLPFSSFIFRLKYKVCRLRSILWEFPYSIYRRRFLPYAGINVMSENDGT